VPPSPMVARPFASLMEYRVLVAIAETGSLGRAARVLYLSQPTLSRHLANLEAALGGRLVERGHVGSRPTELGQVVVVQARTILERMGNLERDARTFADHRVARLSIGSFPSITAEVLAAPLASLTREALGFELFVGEPHEVVVRFRNLAFDVAILLTEAEAPPPVPEWAESETLLDDPLLVVLPPGHAAASRGCVDLEALAAEPWIASSSNVSPEYTILLRTFSEFGREPQFVARTADSMVNQRLVAAGLGVSLVPQLLVRRLSPAVVARPLQDGRFTRRIHMAWRTPPTDVTRKFLDSVRSAVRKRWPAVASWSQQ
jgi:DNA-binding transcriptional LysR family regulator